MEQSQARAVAANPWLITGAVDMDAVMITNASIVEGKFVLSGQTEALAAQYEAATEGSREMSDEMLLALGWRRGQLTWADRNGCETDQPPSPAESVDAGLALLREMEGWQLEQVSKIGLVLQVGLLHLPTGGVAMGQHKLLRMALCAALLRAHAAREKEKIDAG